VSATAVRESDRKQASFTSTSSDKRWRTFHKHAGLMQFIPLRTYYARAKVRGKSLRVSLETNVFTAAKLRLPDKLRVDTITEANCREWAARDAAHYSPTVFNNTVNTLRRILTLAGLGHDENPAMKLKRLGVRRTVLELPTSDQFERLVTLIETSGAAQAGDCGDLVRFLSFAGCRVAEIEASRLAGRGLGPQRVDHSLPQAAVDLLARH
jgi:hypothetical protein